MGDPPPVNKTEIKCRVIGLQFIINLYQTLEAGSSPNYHFNRKWRNGGMGGRVLKLSCSADRLIIHATPTDYKR